MPVIKPNNIYRNPPCITYAAHYKNRYYAAAIWSGPVARQLNGKGYIELRRMVIGPDAPRNTASRLLKLMRLDIKKRFPGVVKLISYQDIDVHHGTIYKASGWNPVIKSKGSEGWKSRKRNTIQTSSDKVRWEYEL